MIGAVALGGDVTLATAAPPPASAGVVLSGHLADVLLVPAGDDVLVIETSAGGVKAEVPANLDPSRRAARVTLDAAPATVLPGARGLLTDVARAVFAAEAAGVAAETTEMAAEYAKVREQFGRPIGTFQAVKHHCANMLVAAELATAADLGRRPARGRPAAATSSATPRRSRRRWPCRPRSATPASTSRCTAASASPGSTTRTCTCAGPPPSPRSLDAEQAAAEVTDLVRARRPPGGRDRPAAGGRADPGGDQAGRRPAAPS